MTALVYASAIYMPILIESAARRYGPIVAGTVAGGVLSEDMGPRGRTGEA
jgi:hypothetical protein